MSYGLPFETLLGKTLTSVVNDENREIIFTAENGEQWRLYHEQDCCESVLVEDIDNDLEVLVGSPILLAEEVHNGDAPVGKEAGEDDYGTSVWTYYKLATIKGYVTIRWFGTSNGYYSEEVSFEQSKTLEDVKAEQNHLEQLSRSRTVLTVVTLNGERSLDISMSPRRVEIADHPLIDFKHHREYLVTHVTPDKGWKFADGSVWTQHQGVRAYFRVVVPLIKSDRNGMMFAWFDTYEIDGTQLRLLK